METPVESDTASTQGLKDIIVREYPFETDPGQTKSTLQDALTVLHVLCNKIVPFPWIESVAIVDLSSNKMQSIESLHGHLVAFRLCIIGQDSHRALCVWHANVDNVVLYDNKQCPGIFERAVSWTKQLKADSPRQQHVIRATMPMQEDSWSCGHRIILAADAVLRHLFQTGGMSAEPPIGLGGSFASWEQLEKVSHKFSCGDSPLSSNVKTTDDGERRRGCKRENDNGSRGCRAEKRIRSEVRTPPSKESNLFLEGGVRTSDLILFSARHPLLPLSFSLLQPLLLSPSSVVLTLEDNGLSPQLN